MSAPRTRPLQQQHAHRCEPPRAQRASPRSPARALPQRDAASRPQWRASAAVTLTPAAPSAAADAQRPTPYGRRRTAPAGAPPRRSAQSRLQQRRDHARSTLPRRAAAPRALPQPRSRLCTSAPTRAAADADAATASPGAVTEAPAAPRAAPPTLLSAVQQRRLRRARSRSWTLEARALRDPVPATRCVDATARAGSPPPVTPPLVTAQRGGARPSTPAPSALDVDPAAAACVLAATRRRSTSAAGLLPSATHSWRTQRRLASARPRHAAARLRTSSAPHVTRARARGSNQRRRRRCCCTLTLTSCRGVHCGCDGLVLAHALRLALRPLASTAAAPPARCRNARAARAPRTWREHAAATSRTSSRRAASPRARGSRRCGTRRRCARGAARS